MIFAKIRKQSFLCLVDTACAGLLVGQIIGRWGNFFNREAFGSYTDGLFAMQIPKDAVAPANITHAVNQHLVTIGGTQYIQHFCMNLYGTSWSLSSFWLPHHIKNIMVNYFYCIWQDMVWDGFGSKDYVQIS